MLSLYSLSERLFDLPSLLRPEATILPKYFPRYQPLSESCVFGDAGVVLLVNELLLLLSLFALLLWLEKEGRGGAIEASLHVGAPSMLRLQGLYVCVCNVGG